MNEYQKYKYKDSLGIKNKILRLVWNIVYYILFRFTPNIFFNKWRIFLLKVFGAKIGSGCIVYPSVKIWQPWNLEMGDLSVLGSGVDCYCVDKIILGSKVAISQRTFLCTASHDITSYSRPLIHYPIIIKDHVWVCAEAFIGPKCTLEEGVVVAARAVVTRDISKYNVVAGNPAQTIKKREVK